MPTTRKFHSINEVKKPAEKRVHHDNSACRPGQDVPQNERVYTDGGYRLCEVCDGLDRKGQ
ncbi:MAG: hypothetical protein ACREHE_05110 [Rhizomicrobium sp.]